MTQKELAKRSDYDAATIGSMLKQMEQRQVIERISHPQDGRAKLVSLTKTGRQTFHDLWEATRELRDDLWECLEPRDQDHSFRILSSLTTAMAEPNEPTDSSPPEFATQNDATKNINR